MFRSSLLLLALVLGWVAIGPAAARADGLCPGASPIAEARLRAPGSEVTVRGVVSVPTGAYTSGRSFALQDSTGGLYVFRQAGIGQELAVGDDVCVSGRLTEYNGLMELMPRLPAQVILLGAAEPPVPMALSGAEVLKGSEGRLVSVSGIVSTVGEARFRINGASVYVYPQTGISLAGLRAGCQATAVGFSGNYNGPQIWPRWQEDLVVGECPMTGGTMAPGTARGCPDVTIAQLQGPGYATPFDAAARFACLDACVTGVAADGFFLQSLTPDSDPRTSEGAFVFRYSSWENPRGLQPGDRVELRGFGVQEFYRHTEIVHLADDTEGSYSVTGRCTLPTPAPVPALTEPAADPENLYEPFEGMRVSLSFDATVVGPTARYASRHPAGDPEIGAVDRASPWYGQRIMASQVPAGRGTIYLSGGLGVDLPDVGTYDSLVARDLTGVLAYQFGHFVLLVDNPGAITSSDAPDLNHQEAPAGREEFTVCTFNTENVFDAVDDLDGDVGDWSPGDAAEFLARVAKRARAIRENLGACTVVGLQEVEGKDAVWSLLAKAAGSHYRYDYFESADERDITVGILYDADRVVLRHSAPAQTCTPTDYGVQDAFAVGARARPHVCQPGSFPLFDRPPYVADLIVYNEARDRSLEMRVVVSHLKSKSGDEEVNLPRRVAQARATATLLSPPLSIALGDLNDTLGSSTLAEFAGRINLLERHVPTQDRYTYIYQGRAEAVDHVIMTPGLDAYLLAGAPVHINADFPEKLVPDATSRRSSDHDPVLVRLAFRPTGVSEALQGAVMGGIALVR